MKLGVLCLLLCLASAQKHEATDEASKEADQWTSDEDTSLRAAASHAPSHALSSEEDDDDDLDLDSEEEPREASEKSKVDTEDHYVYEYDDMDDMYEDDYEDEGEERIKRKVIFGGGGGYGGVQRGRGGGGGGDPYGRRRGNHNYHGPDYGNYGSWPYGRGEYVDTTSFDNPRSEAQEPTTTTTTTTTRPPQTRTPARSRAYGIVRSSPGDGDVPSTSGRKSKTGRRETKRKLPKDLKWEIAEYALQYGTRQAVHHYSQQVGKRISEKKIEKFVRRYQQRQERVEARQN
ncbi:uncharacterized protein LOC123498007 [Portunus trituberculatus]|uniref:uncharacterized protein LOC123498007 n=1 Tax=Portunus trituberculatus TaxID=210409 RepID=UPI001E1CB8D4|nr:uncharacterized protein LOC123498007 [Portunus trituberculatus]